MCCRSVCECSCYVVVRVTVEFVFCTCVCVCVSADRGWNLMMYMTFFMNRSATERCVCVCVCVWPSQRQNAARGLMVSYVCESGIPLLTNTQIYHGVCRGVCMEGAGGVVGMVFWR